jgi:hypothetical protein
MARRRCRRPAGGIGKVQQHSPHCCTYQPTPAEELELIFHIHGRADGQQWNENANAKGNCVLCGAMRVSSPLWPSLSLSGSDRQRISRKVNHEVGPQGRRNVENCAGDNILADLLILWFINPIPSRRPDYGPTHQLVPTTIFDIPTALVAPLHFSELKFTLYTGPPEWECMETIALVPTLVLTEFSFFDFNFSFDWEVLYSHQIVRHTGVFLVRSQHYNHITHWNICCN